MKLIFVYNANAGWLNAAWDSAHKLVSPKTYRCSLCAATHHPLGMKKRWADFVEELACDVVFLHRNEAVKRYGLEKIVWPAVLREDEKGVKVWLAAEALATAQALDQLETLIRERLDDAP